MLAELAQQNVLSQVLSAMQRLLVACSVACVCNRVSAVSRLPAVDLVLLLVVNSRNFRLAVCVEPLPDLWNLRR